MGTGRPREVFRGLVLSEQISAVGCAPVAPFPQLMRVCPPRHCTLSAWGGVGQGRSAEGCRNTVPARRSL